jgi:hypothetical protein
MGSAGHLPDCTFASSPFGDQVDTMWPKVPKSKKTLSLGRTVPGLGANLPGARHFTCQSFIT